MATIAHAIGRPRHRPLQPVSEAVWRDLLQSLRSRQVNHKFHYDSVKQTHKWLALHQAYSPSRNDADCAAIYDASFAAARQDASMLRSCASELGWAAVAGRKTRDLLRLLRKAGKRVGWCRVPTSSTAMVLVARAEALTVIADEECHPLVCDLATADDLPEVLSQHSRR